MAAYLKIVLEENFKFFATSLGSAAGFLSVSRILKYKHNIRLNALSYLNINRYLKWEIHMIFGSINKYIPACPSNMFSKLEVTKSVQANIFICVYSQIKPTNNPSTQHILS
jgi:hypothetical protein